MDKKEYFKIAAARGLYNERDWVINAYCVVRNRPTFTEAKYDGQIIVNPSESDNLYWFDKENNQAVLIDGTVSNGAVFGYHELTLMEADSVPLIKADTQTTYGILLGNLIMLYYPFGDKHPFINAIIGGSVSSWVSKRLADEPEEGQERDPNVVYVSEYIRYAEACGYISSLSPYFSSSGSPNTTTINPAVRELREKLYKQYEGRLHDRTVQAIIEEALVAADKATFENDPDGKAYLIKSKSFNPTRKKLYASIGGSSGFGGKSAEAFIGTSLSEKWKKEDIHIHANEARAGSYFRGKETQYGGYETKLAYRMTMTSTVEEDFCGSTRGIATLFKENMNINYFVGRNVVTKNGPTEITAENVKALIGKRVMIHTPQYCKTSGGSFCAICMGKTYSQLRSGVPSVVAHIGDVFMYDKMKRMHGKPLVTYTVALSNIIY